MNWKIKSFESLSKQELYQILQVRNEVFIVEQKTYYQDLDDKDFGAMHLFLEDEQHAILAYCRIMPKGVTYAECCIGRVLTKPTARQHGYGRVLFQKALDFIEQEWQENSVRISAQCYLQTFYASFGFVPIGTEYLEDDLPHIEMLKS
ncbi:GNAT family N-acetyltransferase [Taibaiella sp. KBW10]|uniref:GNAT family N-acetyltransferase n=1 Tax=Taibaiella sp. KBW10 TaxID=2153357 RepID=UPI000F5AE01A|nr:GNAT family N-acetyltransferase [Taibaiella sp. KBW10]RQO31372.1 GNAT family N-acetyltransferase [Taibaiella sp. KBW10]